MAIFNSYVSLPEGTVPLFSTYGGAKTPCISASKNSRISMISGIAIQFLGPGS